MARAIANVNSLTDTFEQWLVRTNELANAMSVYAVTVETTDNGANVTGNGYVVGTLGANTLAASVIKGGGAFVNVTPTTGVANITLASSLHGGNSTVGVTISANTFGVKTGIGGMNATFGVANLSITTNTVINGYLTLNGLSYSNAVDIIFTSNTNLGVAGTYEVLTFSTTTYSSAKLTVQAKKGVNTEISEVILAANNTEVYTSVYGTVMAPPSANIGTLSANISGSDIRVYYASADDTTSIKILATLFR